MAPSSIDYSLALLEVNSNSIAFILYLCLKQLTVSVIVKFKKEISNKSRFRFLDLRN